jgi:hypothetical protein
MSKFLRTKADGVCSLRRPFGPSIGALIGAPRLTIAKILAKKTKFSPLMAQVKKMKKIRVNLCNLWTDK